MRPIHSNTRYIEKRGIIWFQRLWSLHRQNRWYSAYCARGKITDILLYRKKDRVKEIIETNPRYHTKNTHGTGCTFASAFAGFLAKKYDAPSAFSKAVLFTNQLIDISKDSSVGQGNGPLLHHLHQHHHPAWVPANTPYILLNRFNPLVFNSMGWVICYNLMTILI